MPAAACQEFSGQSLLIQEPLMYPRLLVVLALLVNGAISAMVDGTNTLPFQVVFRQIEHNEFKRDGNLLVRMGLSILISSMESCRSTGLG
jgi:hypothetical protein